MNCCCKFCSCLHRRVFFSVLFTDFAVLLYHETWIFPRSDILLCTFLACLGYLLGGILCSTFPAHFAYLSEIYHELYFCSCGSDPGGVGLFGLAIALLGVLLACKQTGQKQGMRGPYNPLRVELLIILHGLPSFTAAPPAGVVRIS